MDGIGRVALRPGPVKNAKRIGLVVITHTPAALGTALFDRLLVPGRQPASAALLFFFGGGKTLDRFGASHHI